MDRQLFKEMLKGKDNNAAHGALKETETLPETSSEFFPLFDFFLELLKSESNFFSVRGTRMLAAVARWDEEGKLKDALPAFFAALDDSRTTKVRQILASLYSIALVRPELKSSISDGLERENFARIWPSARHLAEKDKERILSL
jgi:hypothetical protein